MTDSSPVDPESGGGSAQLAKRTPATTSRQGGRGGSGARRSSADTELRVPDETTHVDTRAVGAGADVVETDPVATPRVQPVATTDATEPTQGAATRFLGYRRQRFEARKVRRLVRHVDPWSMLKLSLLVSLCMWLMVMIAAIILWTVARNAGTIASVENFVNSSLSLQDWSLDGEFIFRQFGLVTLLLALGLAASLVIATLVFNLISDIIGGVWISVIEEETARPVAESNR